MANSKIVTLFASAARTATTNGGAVGTGKALKPITQDADGFNRHAMVFVDCTAASGTTPTMDLVIQGRLSGSDAWITLAPSAAFTQVTAAGQQQSRRIEGPLPPEIRAVATLGGTTPSFTFSVKAVLGA